MKQGDTKNAKEVWANIVAAYDSTRAVLVREIDAIEFHVVVIAPASTGPILDQRGAFHARQCARAVEQVAIEC